MIAEKRALEKPDNSDSESANGEEGWGEGEEEEISEDDAIFTSRTWDYMAKGLRIDPFLGVSKQQLQVGSKIKLTAKEKKHK